MSFGTHASFVSNSVLGNSTFGTTGHHPSRSRVTLTFGTQRLEQDKEIQDPKDPNAFKGN